VEDIRSFIKLAVADNRQDVFLHLRKLVISDVTLYSAR
jgi:hypothetical protein